MVTRLVWWGRWCRVWWAGICSMFPHRLVMFDEHTYLCAHWCYAQSVGDTQLEGLIRLRNTIEHCLKTFRNKVCSHSKLHQTSTSHSVRGTYWTWSVPLIAVCFIILRTRILTKDKIYSIHKAFRMMQHLFHDINMWISPDNAHHAWHLQGLWTHQSNGKALKGRSRDGRRAMLLLPSPYRQALFAANNKQRLPGYCR